MFAIGFLNRVKPDVLDGLLTVSRAHNGSNLFANRMNASLSSESSDVQRPAATCPDCCC